MRKKYKWPMCSDCHRPLEKSGTCDPCKVERQRLHAIRRFEAYEPNEYQAAKAPLIERYAAIIAAGGRLFEESPA